MIRTVSSDAAALVDDGIGGLRDTIDKCGLAHVGATDDSDDGFHIFRLLQSESLVLQKRVLFEEIEKLRRGCGSHANRAPALLQ